MFNMVINLNDEVLVKLTPYALDLMLKNHNDLYNHCKTTDIPPFTSPCANNEGFTRMLLWEVMQEFGKYMYNFNPEPFFENNELHILTDTKIESESEQEKKLAFQEFMLKVTSTHKVPK